MKNVQVLVNKFLLISPSHQGDYEAFSLNWKKKLICECRIWIIGYSKTNLRRKIRSMRGVNGRLQTMQNEKLN